MFSRVSQKPAEQEKWSSVASIADAIAFLKQEPAGAYFLTPGHGGFIKLEPEDQAYDRKGQQVWPPKQKPGKGFRMAVEP